MKDDYWMKGQTVSQPNDWPNDPTGPNWFWLKGQKGNETQWWQWRKKWRMKKKWRTNDESQLLMTSWWTDPRQWHDWPDWPSMTEASKANWWRKADEKPENQRRMIRTTDPFWWQYWTKDNVMKILKAMPVKGQWCENWQLLIQSPEGHYAEAIESHWVQLTLFLVLFLNDGGIDLTASDWQWTEEIARPDRPDEMKESRKTQ